MDTNDLYFLFFLNFNFHFIRLNIHESSDFHDSSINNTDTNNINNRHYYIGNQQKLSDIYSGDCTRFSHQREVVRLYFLVSFSVESRGGPVRNVHAVLNPTILVLGARCSAVPCASVELLNKTDIFILARSDK